MSDEMTDPRDAEIARLREALAHSEAVRRNDAEAWDVKRAAWARTQAGYDRALVKLHAEYQEILGRQKAAHEKKRSEWAQLVTDRDTARAQLADRDAEIATLNGFRTAPLAGIRNLLKDSEDMDDEAVVGSVCAILLTRQETANNLKSANEAFMRMVRVLTGKPPLSTKSRDLATEALVAVGLAHLKAQVSDALRRRLAAAQADAVALWSLLNAARDVCIAYVLANPKRGYAGQEQDPAGAHATLGRLTEALATPAPGTPLLDAVRALVEAADDQELAEGCECMDTMSGHSHPCAYLRLQDAMNAVRKVLP